jgi:hypothetical protein
MKIGVGGIGIGMALRGMGVGSGITQKLYTSGCFFLTLGRPDLV